MNYARILVLVLSIALLIGSVVCISAAAAEDIGTKGQFGAISINYGDKIYVRVEVDATEEEITSGDVVVSYTLNGETKNATYFETEGEHVWVLTEGIAAYDLAEELVFSSTVGGAQVEQNRTYSVAQFLYKMLYTNSGISEEYRNLYNSLLAYGKAAQIALNKNTDSLVTDSTLVFTENADVKLDGETFAFVPGAGIEGVTPEFIGTAPQYKELEGWKINDNGTEKAVGLTFDCSGVVKVLEPVWIDEDPSQFTLVNGGFENGLEGWTLVGNIGGVSEATHYWAGDSESADGFAFGMDGKKMFSAYVDGASEGAVGTLTSSSFIVGGSGFVTFKLGAMRDGNYVYVDVVDAESKEILARYYNGNWAERTNDVKSGCTLVAYKADLSAFMGKSVFFRLSDNADSGYGLFFADSFNTYYTSEPEGFNPATPVDYEVSGTIYDVFNGGFEMGGVQGWWNVGDPGAVTGAEAFFSGVAYGKDGNFLYSGVEDHGAGNGRERNTGVLTSSVFEIGGTGYISFMLGGGGHRLCFVQVVDAVTGEVLARYHQQAMEDAVLKTYVADLSAYIGRTARVQVIDQAQNNWGCVSFDNVVTYYPVGKALPDGAITANDIYSGLTNEIVNGGFENGLDGWDVYLYEGESLGAVTEAEPVSEWYTKNDGIKEGNLFTFWHPANNDEGGKGTLTSSLFRLEGGSFVSFKFGGAGGGINHDVFIQLVRVDGTVIATFYNDAEGKNNTKMNAYFYQYDGAEVDCFIRVVDNSNSNYGGFVLDSFKVDKSAPEGYLEAIQ